MRNIVCVILIITLSIGCKNSGKNTKNEVTIHLLSDPDKLTPYVSHTADATAIEQLMFQKLISWDYDKKEFVGVLAVKTPTMTEIREGAYKGGLKLDYEIRPEATWDNGTPVTGYDVAFSFKSILNPKTDCEHIRPYYDFLADVVVDSMNPKKFSIISNQKYILAEEYSGYWVLPEYNYDPNKIMRHFTIPQLKGLKSSDSLKISPEIINFAKEFNSQKFAREKGFITGSGPYEFSEWTTGSKIVLKLKKNWWGNKSSDSTLKNYAHIETVKYKIINDWSTTTTAIKGRELDCIKSIEFKKFNELKSDENFNKNYNYHTPTTQSYVYIGMNLNNPKLKDIKVREALAHTLDKDQIIQTLLYGLGTPVESMISADKKEYNKNIKKFPFDIALANKLLDESGWKDTDGDGIRDKMIDGKKENLTIEYKYNSGNETRKNIGLIFKENLKKIGVELNIVTKEFTIFLDDLKKHDFEMYCGSWIGDPNVEDPKQIWHSSSAKSGSNYVNYGDAQSDKLIDDIRKELDVNKRNVLYNKFQEKVHNDIPYIFIYAPLERMAISKKISNASAYSVRPGYDIGKWNMSK